MQVSSRNNPRLGVTIVETAVVLIVFLMFLFSIFEYSRFIMLRHVLDNASREGARLAVVSTNLLTTSDIQNRVLAAMGGQDRAFNSTPSVQVYQSDATGNPIELWTNATFGQFIGVQINATYTPMFASFGFLTAPMGIRATSVMRSEAN